MNLKNMLIKIVDYIFLKKDFICYTLLLFILGTLYFTLDRGLVFHDEAFSILRHDESIFQAKTSKWYKISKHFFLDIPYDRFVIITSLSLSSFFLGYRYAIYSKLNIAPIKVGFWCVIAQFILVVPLNYSPNYLNFSVIIGNLIFACLFIFFNSKQRIFLFFSGMLYASLFFIYVTSTILILPLLLLLVINEPNLRIFIKNSIPIFLGIMSCFFIYFVFVESINVFVTDIIEFQEYLKYDKNHGMSAMFLWIFYIFKKGIFIFLYIIFEYLNRKISFSPHVKIFFYCLFFLSFIYYLAYSFGNSWLIFKTQVFYILLVHLIFNSEHYSRNFFYTNLLLSVIPVFLSFGTDTNYYIRSAFYFPMFFLPLLFYSNKLKLFSKLIIIFLAAVVTLFYASTFFRNSWARFKISNQNETYYYAEDKYIKLDKLRINKLNELKPYISNKKNVLPLSEHLWGYLYLLDAEPLLLFYRPQFFANHYIKSNKIDITSVTLIQDKNNALSKNKIKDLLQITDEYIMEKVALDSFNIYHILKKD